MASRKVAAPSCPEDHLNTSVTSWGTRMSSRGAVRRYRCAPKKEQPGTAHLFTVPATLSGRSRKALDDVVPVPPCPVSEHREDDMEPAKRTRKVVRGGQYTTTTGVRQRYACIETATGRRHKFSAVLPRSVVAAETCCDDCGVPTPANAGAEVSARHNTFTMPVIHTVLRDLAMGKPYASVSVMALDASGKNSGRVRRHKGVEVEELRKSPKSGPRRDRRAHWHVAVDIMETFGPVVTEAALAAVKAEEADYRKRKLPVVYVADEKEVKRTYRRSKSRKATTVVWTALVVSRTRWTGEDDYPDRSNRLLRVRALPSKNQSAWALVFSELDAPDFLVCDGASAIANAAREVWGTRTVVVPCYYHASANIRKGLLPKGMELPEKVSDHLYSLTSALMAEKGPACVRPWWNELEAVMDAAGLPQDGVWNVRAFYEPVLRETARIAHKYRHPMVPISNSGAEAVITEWVEKMTTRRGAMFTNLPRTNLLGDLMVAGSNGFLDNQHNIVQALRADTRAGAGWTTPPRALNEPKGALGLRDPKVVEYLRKATTT